MFYYNYQSTTKQNYELLVTPNGHCTTSRKVAGSNSYVIEFFFFNLLDLSICPMAPGLTQPLTEMNAKNLSEGVKPGRRLRPKPLP
jgi:hypothetical protein